MPTDVNEFLKHYASEYYDPAKAKAYYEANKELKGRQSTEGMSKTQKEALTVAKSNIGSSKKSDLAGAQANQKAKLESVRNRAVESRTRIQAKLKSLIDSIQAKAVSNYKPRELNKIPENASPKMREFLSKQNANISKTNRDNLMSIKKDVSEATKGARKDAQAEMKRVGTELKDAVTNARSTYTEAKKALTAKYETASATEYDNIRSKVK